MLNIDKFDTIIKNNLCNGKNFELLNKMFNLFIISNGKIMLQSPFSNITDADLNFINNNIEYSTIYIANNFAMFLEFFKLKYKITIHKVNYNLQLKINYELSLQFEKKEKKIETTIRDFKDFKKRYEFSFSNLYLDENAMIKDFLYDDRLNDYQINLFKKIIEKYPEKFI
jgi:hypothetical protein